MKFEIYHPVGGELNMSFDKTFQKFEKVYELEASNPEEAFRLTQNDFSKEYRLAGIRSTSVGDIMKPAIQAVAGGDALMIAGVGMIPVDIKGYLLENASSESFIDLFDEGLEALIKGEYGEWCARQRDSDSSVKRLGDLLSATHRLDKICNYAAQEAQCGIRAGQEELYKQIRALLPGSK